MSKLIVFGASGLLGASLVPMLLRQGHEVLTQGRGAHAMLSVNPCDALAVSRLLLEHRPDAVVNLIAWTDVDLCETDTGGAWQANAAVVAALAQGILALGAASLPLPHLVHISTDQVYDGAGPHAEAQVHPVNVYGLSKFAGELLAERVPATVLRTNFYGLSRCPGRTSFSDWIVRNLRERNPMTVFDDVRFSALHLDSLCKVIARCIALQPVGVFNAGCRDSLSKAAFALALAQQLGLSTEQVRVGVATDVALKARRPLDMSLQTQRIEAALGMRCPAMQDEIEHTAKEYTHA